MLAPREIHDDLQHHVMVTEPGAEFKAERQLKLRGFKPWVPQEKIKQVRCVRTMFGDQRRLVDITRPIFRGYLILPLNQAWSFGPLYTTPGLRQSPFLLVCGKPAVLNPVDVERLQGAEQDLKDAPIQGLRYKVGDHIRVTDGPFRHFSAEISKLDDEGRIELLMDILGAQRKLHVTAKQIEALD